MPSAKSLPRLEDIDVEATVTAPGDTSAVLPVTASFGTPVPEGSTLPPPAPEAPAIDAESEYRARPETFFAPAAAALIATGVSVEGIANRLKAVWFEVNKACVWVKSGACDKEFIARREVENLEAERAALDMKAREQKRHSEIARSNANQRQDGDPEKVRLLAKADEHARLANEAVVGQVKIGQTLLAKRSALGS